MQISKEDEKLLFDLIEKHNISKSIITKLVKRAVEVRYQDRVVGLKDEISDLIKEYANNKKDYL